MGKVRGDFLLHFKKDRDPESLSHPDQQGGSKIRFKLPKELSRSGARSTALNRNARDRGPNPLRKVCSCTSVSDRNKKEDDQFSRDFMVSWGLSNVR